MIIQGWKNFQSVLYRLAVLIFLTMSCGLSDDALLVIYILYRNKCFRCNEGYNSKKLERIISKNTDSNFEKVIKDLINNGYIAQIRKKDVKFYISDMSKAIYALNSHGFSVTQGKFRKL